MMSNLFWFFILNCILWGLFLGFVIRAATKVFSKFSFGTLRVKLLTTLSVYTLLLFSAAGALYLVTGTKLAMVSETETGYPWEMAPPLFYEDRLLAKKDIEQSEEFYKLDNRQFTLTGDTLSLVSLEDEYGQYARFDVFIEKTKNAERRLTVDCYTTKFLLYTPEAFDFTDKLQPSQIALEDGQLVFQQARNENIIRLDVFEKPFFAKQFDKAYEGIDLRAPRQYDDSIGVSRSNGFFYMTLPEGVALHYSDSFNVRYIEATP